MASTPDQRRELGDRLKTLRAHVGLSQKDVVGQLKKHRGYAVSAAAYSEWERGLSAPDAQNTAALERLFREPEGSLAAILNYRGEDPTLMAEVRTLRAEVAGLRDLILRLDRSLDGARGAGEAP